MCSVYLLTIKWATRPGPGSPFGTVIAGFGAAITTSTGSAGGGHGGTVARGSGCFVGVGSDSWPDCDWCPWSLSDRRLQQG
jgi:hypothetical protein